MRTFLFFGALILGAAAFTFGNELYERRGEWLGGATALAEEFGVPVGELAGSAGELAGHFESDDPGAAPQAGEAEPPPQAADAQPSIYRYVDDDGNLQFVNSLSQVPPHLRDRAKAAGTKKISRADRRTPRRAPTIGFDTKPRERARRNAEVVVYSTSWCGYCRKTFAWMNARGIDYENRDIDEHDAYKRELVSKTGSTAVPMVEINGRPVQGYNPAMFERLLVARY